MQLLAYLLEYNRFMNLFGILAILVIAYAFSQKRSAVNIKLVLHGLVVQFFFGLVVLKTAIGRKILDVVAEYAGKMYLFADEGVGFVFGNLANQTGPWGFIFGIKVLPVIIFFGAFTALLFYYGIVQKAVYGVSKVIRPLMGTTGPETLCAVANSFLGQTEAPLLIRHYLHNMTKSELLVVMVSGMATISGAILVVFVAMGVPATHLLTASVMAIPGSMVIAKILLPETVAHKDEGDSVDIQHTADNVLDAISVGTTDGLKLALNVAAMLISFLALLAMLNYILGYGAYKLNHLLSFMGIAFRLPMLSIELIFGYLFSPFAYLMGFTGQEALDIGSLLGTKVAVNEVVAFGNMVHMQLSERAVDIVTYALCGFSNFSCIGIQVGGIGALVPEKRKWLSELGLYAVLGGTLSNLLSAMIAGLLL